MPNDDLRDMEYYELHTVCKECQETLFSPALPDLGSRPNPGCNKTTAVGAPDVKINGPDK